MIRTGIVTIAAVGVCMMADSAPAAEPCTSIEARCAVEIGGRCDAKTGKWEYGKKGAGGTTEAFARCIARKVTRERK